MLVNTDQVPYNGTKVKMYLSLLLSIVMLFIKQVMTAFNVHKTIM